MCVARVSLALVLTRPPTPQLVRDFYNQWYRPDLMAVVIVGDFDRADVKIIQSEIETHFATMALPDSPPPFPSVCLPKHPHGLVPLVLQDPELTQTSVSFEFFEPLQTANTLSHVQVSAYSTKEHHSSSTIQITRLDVLNVIIRQTAAIT